MGRILADHLLLVSLPDNRLKRLHRVLPRIDLPTICQPFGHLKYLREGADSPVLDELQKLVECTSEQ